MNNKEPAFTIIDRTKDRDVIENQVQAFLANGGKIQEIQSSLDTHANPQCRVSDDYGLYQ